MLLPNMSTLQDLEWKCRDAKTLWPGEVGRAILGPSFSVRTGSRFGLPRKHPGHRDSDGNCRERGALPLLVAPIETRERWGITTPSDAGLGRPAPVSSPSCLISPLLCFSVLSSPRCWVDPSTECGSQDSVSRRLQKPYSNQFKRPVITTRRRRERDCF